MTIDRTGLVRRDPIHRNTIEEITSRGGHTTARVLDAFDPGFALRGFQASPAERLHFLRLLLAAGFAEALGQQIADAIARELWASTMRPLPSNQPYLPPFYDAENAALGQHLLEQFFVALGAPPELAASAAAHFAEMVAPAEFYDPFWRGLGGRGALDLERMRELIRGRGLEHSSDVAAQRLRNQTVIRPGARRANEGETIEQMIDRALAGAPRRARSGERPRFELPQPARRRTDPGADLLRHRVNADPPQPAVDRTRATRDAAAIREAVEGWGTDEARIIPILSNRSNAEILEIKRAYQEMYGESLEERIQSETSGDLETSLMSMLRGERSEASVVDPVKVNRDVAAIREAVEGWGTDEDALIRILTNRSSAEIQEIARAYEQTYGESLRSRIESETSGDLERTLLAQLDRRDGTETRSVVAEPAPVVTSAAPSVDRNAATQTAIALRQAMEGIGTDEEALISLLRGKTNAELAEIKAAYQQMYGESLEDRVKSETSGDFRAAILGMLSGSRPEGAAVDPAAATRDAAALREAMEGWGTDEDTLTRILTNRSSAQIRAIAQAYQQMYGESLRQRVSDETSGDYRRALLAMIDG